MLYGTTVKFITFYLLHCCSIETAVGISHIKDDGGRWTTLSDMALVTR